jgi:predicted nucleic acid-binding protein
MARKPAPHIYWDSCVFIDCLQDSLPEHKADRRDVLREYIDSAKRGEIKLVTSAFSIAEVVGLSTDKPVSREDAQKIKDFFENPYIHIRGVDRATVEDAADIGRTTKISPSDAVHVATAIRAKCRLLLTYDGVKEPTNPRKMLFHDGKIGVPAIGIKIPSLEYLRDDQRQKDLFEMQPVAAADHAAGCFLLDGHLPKRHPLRPPMQLERRLPTLSAVSIGLRY